MDAYLQKEIEQILKSFDNYPVVLVEVISKNSALDKAKYAITSNTGGYPSINNLEAAGFSSSVAIGITFECIEIMERIREQQAKEYSAILEKNKQESLKENQGCLLTIFISFILFAMFLFWWIGSVFGV